LELGSESDERFCIRKPCFELPNVSCLVGALRFEDTDFGAEFLKFLIVLGALLKELSQYSII
jgi:hypothetical protein